WIHGAVRPARGRDRGPRATPPITAAGAGGGGHRARRRRRVELTQPHHPERSVPRPAHPLPRVRLAHRRRPRPRPVLGASVRRVAFRGRAHRRGRESGTYVISMYCFLYLVFWGGGEVSSPSSCKEAADVWTNGASTQVR